MMFGSGAVGPPTLSKSHLDGISVRRPRYQNAHGNVDTGVTSNMECPAGGGHDGDPKAHVRVPNRDERMRVGRLPACSMHHLADPRTDPLAAREGPE